MKKIDRQIYAFTFVFGTYASYLIGPLPQYEFTLKWLMLLLSCSYIWALGSTYLQMKKGFLWNLMRMCVAYYFALLGFWYIAMYAFELAPLEAKSIYHIALLFLLGTPVVLYKLIPAVVVSLILQAIYSTFRKGVLW